ncbi:MAG TPA: capsule assembly Wzi family protein [Steroidobacteraceae bacterium]|jgi:hypothetical protein|nr:capsule assembly Wzi family protein [Steroidobacteraceae bacterium]
MKSAISTTAWLIITLPAVALGRGVSPYLPLNLEPEIERDIERVLVLADHPVLTRPIPAALLFDAMPKACAVDTPMCKRVRRFLARYMHDSGISYASAQAGASRGADVSIPNEHGLETQNHWQLDGQAYYQPSDYAMASVGVIAYRGRTTATGTMLSLGGDRAQIDIGYRDHWWSPMTDDAMVISTEAPTMPSVTVSNSLPFTRLGLQYELFLARMSESHRILFEDHLTSGHPLFAGFHLQIEPTSGWALGINRILQYGGGGYGGTSVSELFRAFFNPAAAQNPGANPATNNTAFGNQEASITSRFIVPGRIPFAVYFEYAGEDTSRGRSYLLGDAALSAGIHFPRLGPFDLTYEISDWQEGWYVHDVYLDGLVNYGHVTGNWFGDQRQFGDGVGGQSNMVKVGWEPSFGGLLETQYRTLVNASYSPVPYRHEYQALIRYSHPWQDHTVGGELFFGRDVFGQHFTTLDGFVRLGGGETNREDTAEEEFDGSEVQEVKSGEVFVDAGANANRVLVDLSDSVPRTNTSVEVAPHLGIGARRAVSEHQDLGARVVFDEIDRRALVAVRVLDYRYRFDSPLAVSAFFGAARYALLSPAYGYYLGAGAQYRNVLPGWDLSLDYSDGVKVARRHVYSFEPQTGRPDAFYDITSVALYLSHRF